MFTYVWCTLFSQIKKSLLIFNCGQISQHSFLLGDGSYPQSLMPLTPTLISYLKERNGGSGRIPAWISPKTTAWVSRQDLSVSVPTGYGHYVYMSIYMHTRMPTHRTCESPGSFPQRLIRPEGTSFISSVSRRVKPIFLCCWVSSISCCWATMRRMGVEAEKSQLY